MLDLDSLRIFVTAAETENFTRTAQRLHMSQPSVSQHIQNLEQQLGIDLFERHGRRVDLSTAGASLLPLVQEMLRAGRQVEEAALALSGEVAGLITLGCSTSSGKYVVPRVLARYREMYPQVQAAVRVGPRSQVIDWLLAGEADIGITSHRIERSGLHYRRFFEDKISLVVPADHPWAQREIIQAKDLYGERFIFREATAGTQMAVIESLDTLGVDIDHLECVLVLDNSEAIVMAVEENLGVAFVPLVTAERCMTWGH
ncbi:MAG: LysR family transcriptional regulator, partial [Anaerolineae bacterium]|nr:LysR family transcriptional regulator [Anaerolineae bacterium]